MYAKIHYYVLPVVTMGFMVVASSQIGLLIGIPVGLVAGLLWHIQMRPNKKK